ncbi:MAG: NUDIX domain-containing protein [Gordonia sp. (in: high G+C Gram-positive bacteria)]
MTRLRHVLAGAIRDDAGRLLVAQRERPAELAGLWELPGGKAEPGESDVAALRRELIEELGVTTIVGAPLTARIPLPDERILIAYWARIVDGTPVSLDHRALRWIDAAGLRALADAGALVPADTAWVPELLAVLE